MSGIDIGDGGIVAVDPDALDEAATVLKGCATGLARAEASVRAGVPLLVFVSSLGHEPHPTTLAHLADRLAVAEAELCDLARNVEAAAALYRYAELSALAAAMTGTDAARVRARLAALDAEHPGLAVLFAERRGDRAAQREAAMAAWTGAQAGGGAAALLGAGAVKALDGPAPGLVPAGARLRGAGDPVRVRAFAPRAAAAPASLAEAVARVPSGQAQIRIERYTMPDASRQWVVYVSGSRQFLPSRTEPFDGTSNTDLYGGRRSASYRAVTQALRSAGVRPGEPVHAVGHSQGAMVVSRLAAEGDVDVATLVTVGSPVAVDPGPGTLAVALRHTDDPVVALASGGFDGRVGADGGFVVERTTGEPVLPGDAFRAHHLTEYVETAHLVDTSTDPRVESLRDVLGDLADATDVEAVEFVAVRRLSRRASGAADAG